ncbi:MAG: hypothetical protein KA327_02260 [Pseudarcicella sp.]|nr:hypothetical protein [Pseudarcicella sp.]
MTFSCNREEEKVTVASKLSPESSKQTSTLFQTTDTVSTSLFDNSNYVMQTIDCGIDTLNKPNQPQKCEVMVETNTYTRNGYKVTLNHANDELCPYDVTCIWEGNLTVDFAISNNGEDKKIKMDTKFVKDTSLEIGNNRFRMTINKPILNNNEKPMLITIKNKDYITDSIKNGTVNKQMDKYYYLALHVSKE